MVGSLVFTALSTQTGYIVPQEYEICCVRPGDNYRHTKKTMKKALREMQTLRARWL